MILEGRFKCYAKKSAGGTFRFIKITVSFYTRLTFRFEDYRCSATDVAKTLVRYFKSPVGFMISEMGGNGSRIHIVGKDGKVMNNADASQMSIPYKPLEIK